MEIRKKLLIGGVLALPLLGVGSAAYASAATPPPTTSVSTGMQTIPGGPDVGTADGAKGASSEADTGPDSGPGGGGNTQSGSQAGGVDTAANN